MLEQKYEETNKKILKDGYLGKDINNRIHENISEYEALRNEIVSTQATRANYIVYMYSIDTALLIGAIEWNKYFILITFIILMSFQAKILQTKVMIVKLSSFIQVFFEQERDDMHWESVSKSSETYPYERKLKKNIIGKLSGKSSIQLSIISLILFVVLTGVDYDKMIHVYKYNMHLSFYIFLEEKILQILIDVILVITMICLIAFLYYINNRYKELDYDNEMKRYFEKYKNRHLK